MPPGNLLQLVNEPNGVEFKYRSCGNSVNQEEVTATTSR